MGKERESTSSSKMKESGDKKVSGEEGRGKKEDTFNQNT